MDLFGEPTPPPKEKPPAPLVDLTSSEISGDTAEQGPRNTPFCIGHEQIEQQLLEMYKSRRMHHGLIFSGLKGIGKATLAFRFARFLLKHGTLPDPNQNNMFEKGEAPAILPENFDVSPEDPVFRQVASGAHPDLFTAERTYDAAKNTYKNSVDVTEIRKIAPFMRMTASAGGWRVVIIDDADTMKRSAQNALLKILEEPPPNSILILITHRLGALTPTIRSRTKTVNFSRLSGENINQILNAKGCTSQDKQTVLDTAEGSAGRALQFIEEGGVDTLEQILGAFSSYPHWNWTELHVLSDYFARAGQDRAYEQFKHLLQWIFAELCKNKARGSMGQGVIVENKALQAILAHSSLEQLLNICDNLQEHFNKADRANLDKRQVVLNAFSMISA